MARILIIEDDLDVTKVLLRRLTLSGFEVVVAADGYEGVKSAHKEKPDLILLDLMLPCGGGTSVLTNLKMSPHTAFIPVVVLTAIKDEARKQDIIKEGVAAYLEKPYNPEELIKTIKDVLKTQKE
jgi:DNA-binding response OmpR family regulator